MCEKKPYCNREIDACLKKTVKRINKYSQYKTLLCCCGHEKYNPTIIIQHKQTKDIFELFTKLPLPFRKRKRYYRKDKEGFYFIPEIIFTEACKIILQEIAKSIGVS